MPPSVPFTIRNAYGTTTDTTSADATLVAAPGEGKRLVIVYRRFARNTTTDVTVLWKENTTTTDSITLTSEVPGLLEVLPDDLAIRLSANTALKINLSVVASVSWRIRYRIENA